MFYNYVFLVHTVRGDDGSSSEEDDQSDVKRSSDQSNKSWRLLACTKQRARSNSYDSIEQSSTTLSEAQDISETSDVGVSGFLDDEAEEGSLSSEVVESEWEASGESDSCEGGGGFIVDEAKEEQVYRARKKRRRALIDSDSEPEVEVGGVKRRAYIADSSSNEEDVNNEMENPVLKETEKKPPSSSEDEDSESLSEMESKSEVKEGLLQRAEEAYKRRISATTNLHKLIYSNTPNINSESESDSDAPPQVGGLFKVAQKQRLSLYHHNDSSLVTVATRRDWSVPENVAAIKCLFVTGSWGDEDAKTLLADDDALYGDFEDLETGHTHTEGDKEQVEEETEEQIAKKRAEKKLKKRAAFDSQQDNEEGGTYLDDLKREVSEVEQRNKAEFEGLDEGTRQLLEGIRPGSYVRMELKSEWVGGYCDCSLVNWIIIMNFSVKLSIFERP